MSSHHTLLSWQAGEIRLYTLHARPMERCCTQGKLLQKELERDPSLDPANNTARDPVPDLLKALELYPERAEPYMVLSYHAEWLRDHWCDRADPDPPVCKVMQQAAAFDYARLAVNKTDGGVPGGVSTSSGTACNLSHEHSAST